MFGSDAADIGVAAITGIATIVAAALAAYAVIYSVRQQKRPKIVELSSDEKDAIIVEEREARLHAEIEARVWKEVALSRGDDVAD